MTATILIAGGGTGGHVFPGLAVAHALESLADVEVVFAGSPRGLEVKAVPQHGYALELLDVEPMMGGGPARAIRGALVAAKAMRAATGMVGRLAPRAVLSVGGYSGGPAALACVRARVPLAILEPNSVLGLANRMLAPFAKRAYVAWAETARRFRGDKAHVYGVPLRPGFDPQPYAAPPGRRRLLVLGGSQGSVALNERLPFAIARAAAQVGDIDVVHQTGADREAAVREAYQQAGVKSAMVVSFVTDVAQQMASADIIVARGGAVTVAEISAIGRASVIVPFPHAADDHQAKNAMALASLGGALCIRQEAADEVRLGTELALLFADEERRVRMARTALEHGHPYAAEDVARDLLKLAGVAERRKDPSPSRPQNGAANGSSTMHVPTSKVVS
ncbi:MAG TPA: UDP-N-acetylglucosamine--N-acetylmuramyl-(pentapeptide) pyrophosphoryl-undecaprenol N-acetylglucosamine transferase [Labilithrix sp.]|nr:UDP-N-acetylglucosamine--N-acetylmuramyl-(pentapeptide) pyrophosphoryl-undecaprenol N-acetylglucosamine transferase [Labilithrix sp.]